MWLTSWNENRKSSGNEYSCEKIQIVEAQWVPESI